MKNINILKNFTLLYVEDEENTRELLKKILNLYFNKIYIANNGKEGLECYKKYKPDIIISDIMMPKMNGIEMSKKIKEDNPEQIVLFFTAFSDTEFLIEAIKLGINGYLFKPLDKNQFLHTLVEVANKLVLEHEKTELQQKLEHMARYDHLTNLPNRAYFETTLEMLMHKSDRTKEYIALLFIDVDDFKQINDTYGHEVGDIVLQNVAQRLRRVARSEDVVSRLAGDEFAMIIWGIKKKNNLYQILNRILSDINEEIIYKKHKIKISLSIGVTFYPQDKPIGSTALLRQADIAMYKVKNSGKGKYNFFNIEQNNEVLKITQQILEIKEGLKNQEFEIYYEPQVNIKNNQLNGFEALIRWNHPQKGLLSPIDFLPLIENQEMLMQEVSKYVLEKVFNDIEFFNKQGFNLNFNINITSYDVYSESFTFFLKDLFNKYNVIPSQIVLEVIENSAINNITLVAENFKSIKELGVSIAIDDFGTGYSSLLYLQSLPVNMIKVDTSFVFKMLEDKKSYEIVKASISLGKAFEYKVVAEGIENIQTYKEIKKLNCDIAQGYLFSKPLPKNKIENFIKNFKIGE